MTKSFSEQVRDMVDDSKKALIGVARAAIQDTINEAQKVGPSVANPSAGRGGRMPVDTGFLRASGTGSLSGWPTGVSNKPSKIPRESLTYTYIADDVKNLLSQLDLGDTFYFGWTAEYAVAINVRYGFLDAALQNWPMYVDKRAKEAAKRMKK